MWIQLRKRILQRVTENKNKLEQVENKDEQEKQKEHLPQQNERSFRFPLIPDRHEEMADPSPRKKRDRERFSMGNKQKIDQNKDEYRDIVPLRPAHRQTRREREKRRFIPTRFVSPVYGYQDRKDQQKIEQVPSYMRQHPIDR